MKSDVTLCPSSRCAEGHLLIGVVQSGGQVAFLPEALEIDAAFVETAQRGRPPEKRFRFASPCLRGGCQQWTDGRCSVIDRVRQHRLADSAESEPDCAIRTQCRWYAQSGPSACQICPLVVTDHLAAPGAFSS